MFNLKREKPEASPEGSGRAMLLPSPPLGDLLDLQSLILARQPAKRAALLLF